tara:strand:- start:1406 stop:3727 length:2322 start_codon:yes stop_codon:yes gene_type:complete
MSQAAWAESFVIKSIQVQGLHHLSKSTVLSYVPVSVGNTFTDTSSGKIITTLYRLGYFDNIQVSTEGSMVIIKVAERPTIGILTVSGNKSITKKQLAPVLKQAQIEEGAFYDPARINQFIEGLKLQYAMLGRHAATVDLKTKQLSNHRVSLAITVHEGPVAVIKKIVIKGAPQFSQRQLKQNFTLTTPGLTTFLSHKDRYSEQQLNQDLEQLKAFFLNRGYLQYRLLSKDVHMTDDHKAVSITVSVSPGSVFSIGKIKISQAIQNDPKLSRLITLNSGDVFSRAKVIAINKSIGDRYADQGYAFPKVHVVPTLNTTNKTVDLSFSIDKGRLTYVRHVGFSGNTMTQDSVLRYQLRQYEGAPFSLEAVNESKRKIALLPYLKNVKVKTVPVKGDSDQVDLDYSMEEVKAGSASLSVGFSDVDGLLYGVSLSEPNFLGSGRLVSLSFQKSDYSSRYSYSYVNPFYSINGISRGFNLSIAHYDPSDVDLDTYDMDQYTAGVNYSMPISENTKLSWGGAYKYVDIGTLPNTVSPSVQQFVDDNEPPYNEFNLIAGLSFDGRNRSFFPTEGGSQSFGATVSLPVLDSSLPYYLLRYKASWYLPVGHGFIMNPHTTLAFGDGYGSNDQLPFFDNLYAGGIETLPGYEPGGLGPYYKYTEINSDGTTDGPYTSSLGGNVEIIGGLNMIFPNPFPDNVRTLLTLDAGNIFQTYDLETESTSPDIDGTVTQESIQLKNLRVTAGVMVQWRTFMPLNFSLAYPLNKQSGDLTQPFTFSASAAI